MLLHYVKGQMAVTTSSERPDASETEAISLYTESSSGHWVQVALKATYNLCGVWIRGQGLTSRFDVNMTCLVLPI